MAPLAPHFLALMVALAPEEALEALTYDLKRPDLAADYFILHSYPGCEASPQRLGQEIIE